MKRIRIFGSYECHDCLKVLAIIKKSKSNFEYIDAFEDNEKIQNFCDKHNVDELPHIQFIDEKENILIEHIGEIDADKILKYIIDYNF